MVALKWDEPGTKIFETGVSYGVLYPRPNLGVPWNGLVSINHTVQDTEFEATYQDGIKVHNRAKPPQYSSTLEAYTYPDEFAELNGTLELAEGFYVEEQSRKPFNLSYQTIIGNDLDPLKSHYKIHLVYNALTTPSSRSYSTLSSTLSLETFSWDIETTPVILPGLRPSSHFIVDSRKTGPLALEHLKRILYGSSSSNPRIPSASELVTHFKEWHVLYPSSTTFPSSNTYPGGP